MTTVTGCSDSFNGNNKEDIESLFSDFMTVFQKRDYDFLYDKAGNTSNLILSDLGTWVLSSYMDTKDETTGVIIAFNRNYRKSKGYFIYNENKHPVIFEKNEVTFIEEDTSTEIKSKLADFKFLFDILSFDIAYLNSLESKNHYYNDNVPLYGTRYNLSIEDKNIDALKKAFPSYPYNDGVSILEFEGSGTLWNTTANATMRIILDEKGYNYFSASMNFSNSEKFEELF